MTVHEVSQHRVQVLAQFHRAGLSPKKCVSLRCEGYLFRRSHIPLKRPQLRLTQRKWADAPLIDIKAL